MSKNILNFRFGVKRSDGYISSVWRLWATRHRDVYLALRSCAGTMKYSFHKSSICRDAFTLEHGVPQNLNDRAMAKWNRSVTPSNIENAARVAWLAFPTDFLSRRNDPIKKDVTWIDAAPAGGATYVELAYTSGSEKIVRNLLCAGGNRCLLKYTPLSNDEALILLYYHGDWENNDLKSPAVGDSIFPSLLFSADDPDNTGRPIRIIFGSTPKDGDALVVQELGGYRVE